MTLHTNLLVWKPQTKDILFQVSQWEIFHCNFFTYACRWSSPKLIFVLPSRSRVFTVVAESSFPFFCCMTTRERPGKTKIGLCEDVYIRPWSLSHNFCVDITNTCGRSANNCGHSDKMCLALKYYSPLHYQKNATPK